MSKIALSGNASGTGTLTIAAPNTSTDRTLTLPDNTGTLVSTGSTAGVTQAMLASGVAGNGPAFSAYQSSAQSVATATYTKVQLQTESFDTNSCFDSTTNYRFTPTVAGYYQLNWRVGCNNGSGEVLTTIYKNGVGAEYGPDLVAQTYGTGGSSLFYANGSTDYFELYFYQASGSSKNTTASSRETWFNGALVRAA